MKVLVRMGPTVSPAVLATVRELPRLELAHGDASTWLRGEISDPVELQRLRALPHDAIYQLGDALTLIPLGQRLPTASLSEDMKWRTLKTWLDVRFPVAALAGRIEAEQRVPLKLVRDPEAQLEPNLLIARLDDLRAYVIRAVQVRFRGLSFAVSGERQAVVRGELLPPIRGAQFVMSDGLALPLGWKLALPLGGAVVRNVLEVGDGEIAIMHVDESVDRLSGDDFLAVTRSAVRLTEERLAMREEGEGEA